MLYDLNICWQHLQGRLCIVVKVSTNGVMFRKMSVACHGGTAAVNQSNSEVIQTLNVWYISVCRLKQYYLP